jgi:hypothetical protein
MIQQILRHGDVATTAKFYRKTRRPAVTKAMQKLSQRLSILSDESGSSKSNNGHTTDSRF